MGWLIVLPLVVLWLALMYSLVVDHTPQNPDKSARYREHDEHPVECQCEVCRYW